MRKIVTRPDGTDISYHDIGPRRGPAVVLCHGLAAQGRQFRADAEWFAARGFRVIVPDLRGHGLSGRPAVITAGHFTIPVMADDLIGVLDHAGLDAVHWVGNSLGGILALDMIGRVPGRFASLATFGTVYSLALPPMVAPAFPLIYRLFGRGIVSGVTARATTDSVDGRALVGEMLGAFDPQVGQAIAANVRRYDLIAAALGYRGEILLIRGGRDRAVNAALRPTLAAMRGRANFTRVDLRGAAHCANLDLPDTVRAVLEDFWLNRAAARVAA